MKGATSWSYAPYKPLMFDSGDIYICRVAPYQTSFTCDWISDSDESCTFHWRKEGEGDFQTALPLSAGTITIFDLEENTDYEFFVSSDSEIASITKKSRARLVRTGKPVEGGTIINYLHPRDDVYKFSGHSLCSPSIVRHPDGFLLSSMDVFSGGAPQNLTLIFRSDDDGCTWRYETELFPAFWTKLFIHKNVLYAIACSTEYGDLLIGRSDDGGKTFGAPTVLFRGSCHTKEAGVHKNPQLVVEHSDRLWITLEWGAWAVGYHAPMMASIPIDADLLDVDNWTFTPPLPFNRKWPGLAEGVSNGNIEGCPVIGPDGELYNIMRYDMSKSEPNYGRVVAYKVNTKNPEKPLVFDRVIGFPGNHSKFEIQFDEESDLYYSIISRIRGSESSHDRNLLSLVSSPDLDHWSLVCDLIDRTDCDPKEIGFQYVDFFIEGNDILYQCRTAINGAHNFHDANYAMFHRVKDFRSIAKGDKANGK